MFGFASNKSFKLSWNICVHKKKGISSFPIFSSCLIMDEASYNTKHKFFINAALKIGNPVSKSFVIAWVTTVCNRISAYQTSVSSV